MNGRRDGKEERERWRRYRGRTGGGKKVAWFSDNTVRVPNPLRSAKALCEVEKLKVLLYLRDLSIWNQRKDVIYF